MSIFKIANFQITQPGFHFGVPKKHDVATKLISYERYGEILFQKVASGYLLHFVQDGTSKHTLEKQIWISIVYVFSNCYNFNLLKLNLCLFTISNYQTHINIIFIIFKFSNYTARLPFWSTKKRNVATKTIPYERYGEILFQKVASGYLLHFAQGGSSKNAIWKICFWYFKMEAGLCNLKIWKFEFWFF